MDAERPASEARLRVAYLCSAYPAPSHTFVLREVQALRQLGVEVETFTVRRASFDDLLSDADRIEGRRTSHLLPTSVWRLVRATWRLLRAPRGVRALRAGVREAWEMRRPGLHGTLWQLFYLVEAVLLWRECSRRSVRHIHAHFANVAADVALLAAAIETARAPRAPWSWSFTMHGPAEFWDVAGTRLAAKVERAGFVVCISDFARSQLIALTSVEISSRLHVVHCGLDTATYGCDNGPFNDDAGSGLPTLLCVGRLVPVKGQALLVEAVAELQRRGRQLNVEIIGEGPARELLAQLIREHELEETIQLLGALGQDRVPRHMRAATIFVLPSFAEGVPVVAMEAMALGTPVVTTRIAGVPELIEDRVSGLLVTPGRVDQLVAAIEELLRDDALRRRIADAARLVIQRKFDSRTEAHKLASLFSQTAPLGYARFDGG